MKINKNIEKILDKVYIQELFKKRSLLYFPSSKNKGVSEIKIERISPPWYTQTCLAKYKVFFSDSTEIIIRASAGIDNSRKRTFKIMQSLYQNGFGKGKFQTPRPLDYINESGALFYQEVSGTPLSSILVQRKLPPLEIFENSARFLAKLHSFKKIKTNAIIVNTKDYKITFDIIRKIYPEISELIPPLKKIAFVDKISKGNSFIHADFYPGNIIIKENKMFFIDFDKAGKGSFLQDLVSLTTSLTFPKSIWTSNFTKAEVKEIQKVFLKTYSRIKGISFSEIEQKSEKFSIKILIDALRFVVGFAWEEWKEKDIKIQAGHLLKVKDLLKKINENL